MHKLIILILSLIIYLFIFHNDVYEYLDTNISANTIIPKYGTQENPYIKPVVIPNLLDDDQCRAIRERAITNISDFGTIEGKAVYIQNRQHTFIKKNDTVIQPILQAIADIVYLPYENVEDMLVARYLPYETFGTHIDSCCNNNNRCKLFIKRGGQRLLSLVIYLNDDFDGGSTLFTTLNLNIKPPIGGAIVYHSLVRDSNECSPNGIYKEQVVTNGIKWIARVWFRENTFV